MKKSIYLLPLIILMLGACSSVKVVSDMDKTIDFTKLKTYEYYGWADNSDLILTRFDKERIEGAFKDEFTKRGLEYVEKDGDLVVLLHIIVEDKSRVSANTSGYGNFGYGGGYYGYGPGWGWGGGYGGYGMGMSTTYYDEIDYKVGTLVIDVYHAVDKKLIWESIGTKTVDDNPETREKSLPKSIAKIMAPYPVAPIKE